MRDYGKVHTAFWQSPTVTSLNDDGKLLALYLLTTQHGNLIGCFRLPDAYVAEDLGWSVERVREGFAETVSKGFANRCETTKWVYLPQFLKFNPLENPNQRTAAAKLWAQVPNDVGFRDFVEPFRNPSGTVSKPVAVAVAVKETSIPPLPSGNEPAAPTPPPTATTEPRATRLPADWSLTTELEAIGNRARADAGLPPINLALESAKFADFWRGKSGKDGTKLDWTATWRNWCRNASVSKGAAPAGVPERRLTLKELGVV